VGVDDTHQTHWHRNSIGTPRRTIDGGWTAWEEAQLPLIRFVLFCFVFVSFRFVSIRFVVLSHRVEPKQSKEKQMRHL